MAVRVSDMTKERANAAGRERESDISPVTARPGGAFSQMSSPYNKGILRYCLD
jgi:hypothetical protein